MSTPVPTPDRTPARVDALRDVVFGLIWYDPIRGQYLKGGVQVPGARGRTFRELRGDYACIAPSDPRKTAKVVLTNPIGEQLAIDWGLKNPDASGEVAEPVAAE